MQEEKKGVLALTRSVALVGADGHVVDVEVYVGGGLPAFRIVGLPTTCVREAEQRVRAAIEQSGQKWHPRKITANLAPAGLRKDGTHFDLSLALGILRGYEVLDPQAIEGWVCMGELGLDGSVRSVRGVLAAAIACKRGGYRGLICPAANANEAAAISGIEVMSVPSLRTCLAILEGKEERPEVRSYRLAPAQQAADMADVRGQDRAKRALEVAAAGRHNVLLVGPPGSGKTMLAQRLPGILPPMSEDESMDVSRIHSVAGLVDSRGLVTDRPFRAPHHNVSTAGLVGGGAGLARPGEVSLAHHGVLFLDELSLYRKDILENLRGPLEDGCVRLARSGGSIAFPSRFSLVAAMNPCPCGYREDAVRPCRCSRLQLLAYDNRISGPLLDRIDIEVAVPRLSSAELVGEVSGESSATIRERVAAAIDRQTMRYGSSRLTNSSAPRRAIEQAGVTDAANEFIRNAIDRFFLTGRGATRLLRIARTVADLEAHAAVDERHVVEALEFRLLRKEVAAA